MSSLNSVVDVLTENGGIVLCVTILLLHQMHVILHTLNTNPGGCDHETKHESLEEIIEHMPGASWRESGSSSHEYEDSPESESMKPLNSLAESVEEDEEGSGDEDLDEEEEGIFTRSEALRELRRQNAMWMDTPIAYQDKNITCYHQHDGGSVHRFKYEVVIESDPLPVVAIARELDLMPTWHKFVAQSKIVEAIASRTGSLGGIWGYVEVWFPWPLSNRAMVVKCEVMDVLDEEGALLVRLLTGEYEGPGTLPTTSDQCPRLSAQNLTQVVPLTPTADGTPRTKFVLFVDCDFQTNMIPGFIINFIIHVMSPLVYTQVKVLLESQFGGNSHFVERMNQHPEVYETISKRLQQFQQIHTPPPPAHGPHAHEDADPTHPHHKQRLTRMHSSSEIDLHSLRGGDKPALLTHSQSSRNIRLLLTPTPHPLRPRARPQKKPLVIR